VCEFYDEDVGRAESQSLFQTKGAERAGDIFFFCALLKTNKFFQEEGEPTTKRINTFASFFLPSFKRTHEHKHAHTHTHTHYLSNNNNNIVN
jgi:hypothetical protein